MYSKHKCVINIVNTREVQNKYQISDNVNTFCKEDLDLTSGLRWCGK